MPHSRAIEAVRFYSRHRGDFVSSCERVYLSETREAEDSADVRRLAEECYVRGLEGHIVPIFQSHRSNLRKTVVGLQRGFAAARRLGLDDAEGRAVDDDRVWEALSECSMINSRRASKFAARMAQIDHLEALKSSMSRWRPEGAGRGGAFGVEGFFDRVETEAATGAQAQATGC